MSKQDYRTPQVFLDAVARRFGLPTFDLCATSGEQISSADAFFSPGQDALTQDWSRLSTPTAEESSPRVAWLNPPFRDIGPWAKKLVTECRDLRRWTLMLVPASIGTAWFSEYVLGNALVLGLSPRLTFVGCDTPYPKDLMLVCVGFGVTGFDTWRWDSCPCEGEQDDPGLHLPQCRWSEPPPPEELPFQ